MWKTRNAIVSRKAKADRIDFGEEFGCLRCTLGDCADEEVVVNPLVGYEVNFEGRLRPEGTGLRSVWNCLLVESGKVVKVASQTLKKSAKRYLGELQLWAIENGGWKVWGASRKMG
eukprot:TRINITY_DN3184_c0_g3_i1.p1 TRINITY_DN3184_c0_g3~~TRINITY_DN3184_c0_g3_i1.p1  ORF type:complete len:116 (-),score=22.06 TRINITY_DN3184_c0_g3_i1:945-1292(-)